MDSPEADREAPPGLYPEAATTASPVSRPMANAGTAPSHPHHQAGVGEWGLMGADLSQYSKGLR